jgi:hypothetical protein
MYEKGKMYTKKLKCTRVLGNAHCYYIHLKDEDGVELIWMTTSSSNTYKYWKQNVLYKFTIKFFGISDNAPWITRISFAEEKDKKWWEKSI